MNGKILTNSALIVRISAGLTKLSFNWARVLFSATPAEGDPVDACASTTRSEATLQVADSRFMGPMSRHKSRRLCTRRVIALGRQQAPGDSLRPATEKTCAIWYRFDDNHLSILTTLTYSRSNWTPKGLISISNNQLFLLHLKTYVMGLRPL